MWMLWMHRAGRTALLIAGLWILVSCTASVTEDEVGTPPLAEGALDVILLGERSGETGPLLFAHHRHHAARARGGLAIACGTCHHDYEGPTGPLPGSCRTCHVSHNSGEEAVAGYL